jgi:hypothetical protein
MGNANIQSGGHRIKYSLRNLLEHWDQVKALWDDEVSRQFELRQLVPLERAVNSAVKGIEDLAETAARVRKECSDPGDPVW